MVGEMRDVLKEPLELEAGLRSMSEQHGRFHGCSVDLETGTDFESVNLIKVYNPRTNEPATLPYRVVLRTRAQFMTDHGPFYPQADFASVDDARAEFNRLAEQIRLRTAIRRVVDELYVCTGVLPGEFLPSVKAGDLGALLVAADYVADRGDDDETLLLRAAYHRAVGARDVTEPTGAGKAFVYYPGVDGGTLVAAVVTPKESVRILALRPKGLETGFVAREFKVGTQAEYDSYNLSYYGRVKSISDKSVVVTDDNGRRRVLKIDRFVMKNYDFDLATARKRNADFMD